MVQRLPHSRPTFTPCCCSSVRQTKMRPCRMVFATSLSGSLPSSPTTQASFFSRLRRCPHSQVRLVKHMENLLLSTDAVPSGQLLSAWTDSHWIQVLGSRCHKLLTPWRPALSKTVLTSGLRSPHRSDPHPAWRSYLMKRWKRSARSSSRLSCST